ncbi:hypothetical protein ACFL6K_02270 [Candidatus Latescibacterota bacterium]
MKKAIMLFPILLLITTMLFSGCLVTSIHPLGNEDDMVFDENLIGAWMDDDEDFWIFTKGEEKSYDLIIAADGEQAKFIARLIKLEDKLFLDISPERLDTGNIIYDVLMFPTHTFLKVSLDDSGLGLVFNDPEWFTDIIDQNDIEVGIDFVVTEDDVITLTATTEQLQVFYLENADRPGFFDLEEDKLIRSTEFESYIKVDAIVKEKLSELSDEDIKLIIIQLEKAGEKEKLEQKQKLINQKNDIEMKNGVERNSSVGYINVKDELKEKLAELNEEEVKTLIEQFEKAGETEKALEQRLLLLQLQSFKQVNFKEKDGQTVYTFPSQKE